MTLTEEQLAEIAARADAASGAEWDSTALITLLIHARTDVPLLVAEVRRCWAALDSADDSIDRLAIQLAALDRREGE